jgi:hypothetical protein
VNTNIFFAKDLADYRHAELMAQAEQSRRYHEAAAAARTQGTRSRRPVRAARRPIAAVHAWLVAGTL